MIEWLRFIFLGGSPGGLPGLALGVAVAIRMARNLSAPRKAVCILFFGAGGYCLGAVVFFAWVLRDGLGPNAVTSSGIESIKRFAELAWPAPLICAAVLLAGWKIATWRLREDA